MVAIKSGLRLVGFTEDQELLARHAHIKQAIAHCRTGADDLLIEACNARQRAMRDIKFDIRHAERDAAELFGIRAMAAHAIAPGAGHIHMILSLGEAILRAFQPAPRAIQPMQQLRAIRQHQARCAAQYLRGAAWQMELADAGISPHIVNACHQIRVTRQAKGADVKGRGLQLIRHLQIDMLQFNDIAEGFLGPIPGAGEFRGAIHCFAPFVCCCWLSLPTQRWAEDAGPALVAQHREASARRSAAAKPGWLPRPRRDEAAAGDHQRRQRGAPG